jgi:hypothetical protein
MEVTKQFGRTAQAYGKIVGETFVDDQTAGKSSVFYTKLDLRLHMIASDDKIPEPRSDNEGKQQRENGLQAAVTG